MDDDQQFCLRWNNHQSTLISVIDTLLVKETLVDCTLAAEGKYLKAHKVVLCACSPYFETLLSQQFDKHPIIILKDVKFQELKAMMDYMYRGEVNISQDQLAALLKAAESLQIKGLSDNRKSDEPPRKREALAPPVAKSPPPPAPSLPHVKGLTIEQKRQTKQIETEELNNLSREGSQSPIPRKRKKPRRRASQDDGTVIDNHDASNSSDATALSNIPLASAATSIPVPSTSQSKPTDNVPAIESVESIASSRSNKNNIVASPARSTDAEMSSSSQVPVVKEKLEPHSELMLEPKAEYIDEDLNDDSVEDLTLDDDDMNEMGLEHARPGPSHGGQGEGSGQGFGSWHMAADRSQDEVFMAAQEAVGAHRDSQDFTEDLFAISELTEFVRDPARKFVCPECGNGYKYKHHLVQHQDECGKVATMSCHICSRKYKRKYVLKRHLLQVHKVEVNNDDLSKDYGLIKSE